MMFEKHFVHFLSPGTFISEETIKPIDSWSVEQAIVMARGIHERHNSTPYGFLFVSRSRNEGDFDSHETARSGMYFLGGTVLTLDEVRARQDPADEILISNMEINGFSVIENTNSHKITVPFTDEDMVIDGEEFTDDGRG